MESIKKLYKIGRGPSSSHTMGPSLAATSFLNDNKEADYFVVTLYGSLSSTGKGHYTDQAIYDVFGKDKCKVIFDYETVYDYHPNGMKFEAFKDSILTNSKLLFSVGGGTIKSLNEERFCFDDVTYKENSMAEILKACKDNNLSLFEYVKNHEDDIISYMNDIVDAMINSVKSGLYIDGMLPGALFDKIHVERKAKKFYLEYIKNHDYNTLVSASSLAASEVNASSGIVVTAPTCGSSGVLAGIVYAEMMHNNTNKDKIIEALMCAGIIGNVVKTNASIAGAEVGCQGEVGVACAMAAAFKSYLLGGSNEVIEYAAEIALEHHLGMTCDPIDGKVLIPCIERNAIAAVKALNIASYAIIAGENHYISFDDVVKVMKETGKDMLECYRETSKGGLAKHAK